MALSLELLNTAPYVLIEPQLCSEAIQKLPLDGAVIGTFEYWYIIQQFPCKSILWSKMINPAMLTLSLVKTHRRFCIYGPCCSKAISGRMVGWLDGYLTRPIVRAPAVFLNALYMRSLVAFFCNTLKYFWRRALEGRPFPNNSLSKHDFKLKTCLQVPLKMGQEMFQGFYLYTRSLWAPTSGWRPFTLPFVPSVCVQCEHHTNMEIFFS